MTTLLLTSQSFAESLGCKSLGSLGWLDGSTLLVFEVHTFLLALSLGKLNTCMPCSDLFAQPTAQQFTMLTFAAGCQSGLFTTLLLFFTTTTNTNMSHCVVSYTFIFYYSLLISLMVHFYLLLLTTNKSDDLLSATTSKSHVSVFNYSCVTTAVITTDLYS